MKQRTLWTLLLMSLTSLWISWAVLLFWTRPDWSWLGSLMSLESLNNRCGWLVLDVLTHLSGAMRMTGPCVSFSSRLVWAYSWCDGEVQPRALGLLGPRVLLAWHHFCCVLVAKTSLMAKPRIKNWGNRPHLLVGRTEKSYSQGQASREGRRLQASFFFSTNQSRTRSINNTCVALLHHLCYFFNWKNDFCQAVKYPCAFDDDIFLSSPPLALLEF